MLTEGNCLIFRKCKDLRNMMEDMDRYQGEIIHRDWFEACERTINEKGVVYVIVKEHFFVSSRHKPFDVERYIEVNPRKNKKNNKGW